MKPSVPIHFGAAFYVAVGAGDNHSDFFRVLESDAVLGAGIPNGVGRWEFTNAAFDFQRAASLVHIQAPLSDVAMVADNVDLTGGCSHEI
jgi:hypothetical protein